MKHYRTVPVVAVFAGSILAGDVVHRAPANQARTPIDGIWEYIGFAGRRGQSFFVDGHCVHFLAPSDSTNLPAGTLSESSQATLYAAVLLDAGTYSVSDSIVTEKREYNKNPRVIGVTWRWSFSIKGDTMTFHPLNAAGQPTSTGRAVRVSARR